MGTTGYTLAATLTYEPDEVILEIGSGISTEFLSRIGPKVITFDVDWQAHLRADVLVNVDSYCGAAELIMIGWDRPIGLAWLDGWDWPYTGNPPEYYAAQRQQYATREAEYSQQASRTAHLGVARQIAGFARVIAFDDTWRTHVPEPDQIGQCQVSVPPATPPAPRLAMDQPLNRDRCLLLKDHPHHDDPERGWNGKGGEAIPYLLDRGYHVLEYGLGLVVLKRDERWTRS